MKTRKDPHILARAARRELERKAQAKRDRDTRRALRTIGGKR